MKEHNQNPNRGYILIPFLLYLLVELLAVTAAEAAVMLHYAIKHVSDKTEPAAVWEYITANYETIYQLVSSKLVEFTTVGAVATLILAVVIIRKDRKKAAMEQSLREKISAEIREPEIKSGKPSIGHYAGLILFGFAACVVLNNLCNLMGLAFYSAAYQETSEAMYSASFAVQIVCLGIVIPISEECIFRGVLFRRFRRINGFSAAMLYSTVLFALMHGNMVQMVYAFALGMFLAYVYEKFCSLAAPVILHIAVNLTSLILTAVGGFDWMYATPLRLGAATISGTFIAACIFVVFRHLTGELEKKKTRNGDAGIQ